jgi:hypothetical protein
MASGQRVPYSGTEVAEVLVAIYHFAIQDRDPSLGVPLRDFLAIGLEIIDRGAKVGLVDGAALKVSP